MAIYRQVHVSFWQDSFVLNLTPEEKYFYLYLMTNSKTSQCGIYELPKKIMMLETGYNDETIEKLINRFIGYKKILYNTKTNEIMLLNWVKYNSLKSPKVKLCVKKELESIKTNEFVTKFKSLIQYEYGIDTESIDYGEEEEKEEEEEQEEEKENNKNKNIYSMSVETDAPTENSSKVNYNSILKYWNENSKLAEITAITDKRKGNLNARIKEHGIEAIFKVIDNTSNSSFMRGNNGKNWMATFDWVFLPNNFVKVLEGNYLDQKKSMTNEIQERAQKVNNFFNIGKVGN